MAAKSQPDRRKYARFTDQHGRKWGAVIETDTLAPTGPVKPVKWTAPWLPNQQYMRFGGDGFEYTRMEIDYDKAVADLERSQRQWQTELEKYATGTYGQKAADALREPTPDMLTFVGPRPMSVEIVKACRAGNKWALGLVNPATGQKYAEPAWAAGLIPQKVKPVEHYPDAEDEAAQYADLDALPDAEQFADADEDAPVAPASTPARRGRATARA